MKSLILFVLVIFPYSSFSKDILANTSWKCNQSAFEDSEIQSYTLTKYSKDENWGYHYGYSIDFSEGTFITNYSAPCGVDCFTTTTGTYEFVGAMKIKIYVSTIERSGFCQLKNENNIKKRVLE